MYIVAYLQSQGRAHTLHTGDVLEFAPLLAAATPAERSQCSAELRIGAEDTLGEIETCIATITLFGIEYELSFDSTELEARLKQLVGN
tara:strand:+ start:374 stop:637 length:264 start_codon:yes stop_codon:yes gene_type:complete